MKNADIIHRRLANQLLTGPQMGSPGEIVLWMVAMQSQDFTMAKWAIALRNNKLSHEIIDAAFNEGKILRTHLMRPTWHFVSPGDIRWLVHLTAPRIKMIMAGPNRKLNLDATTIKRTNDIIAQSLMDGKFLTRPDLQKQLKSNGITAEGERMGLVMMNAELDLVVCSGPRIGKQFTYALLDERVPPVPSLSREETLSGFAKRYFDSRWPATIHDFAYWSGLTIKDARDAVASLGDFKMATIGEKEYVVSKHESNPPKKKRTFLMPDYDEYGMSYKDRDIILPGEKDRKKISPGSYHVFVVDGKIGGTWKRVNAKGGSKIKIAAYTALDVSKKASVEKAIKEYLSFLGKE